MQSAFETYFTSLKGKRIAVLGLGVSNRPLVRLLLEFGCDVLGCDRTPREKLDAEVLQLEKMGCKHPAMYRQPTGSKCVQAPAALETFSIFLLPLSFRAVPIPMKKMDPSPVVWPFSV